MRNNDLSMRIETDKILESFESAKRFRKFNDEQNFTVVVRKLNSYLLDRANVGVPKVDISEFVYDVSLEKSYRDLLIDGLKNEGFVISYIADRVFIDIERTLARKVEREESFKLSLIVQ